MATFWAYLRIFSAVVPIDASNNRFMEVAETNLFGFAPFKNTSSPDLATGTKF